MLNLANLAKWMRGLYLSDNSFGLPKSVYDDIVPSGMHRTNYSEF